ncbi:MAG: NADH-quinone oxidoreductase subunit I [Planctomycetes bacterium]|nr:NADH-quinone oxidoreductase subunit I [Planctomycetota bacterium]
MRDVDIIVLEEPVLTSAERLYLPQIIDGFRITLRHMFSVKQRNRTVTQYPEQRRVQRVANYRGMHRLNKDPEGRVACVACFMCATACPVHCIHIEAGAAPWPDREKYPVKFDIDELRCIYCGMCEEACPCDAIELTPDYELVGSNRAEMIFDKEKLLHVYDETSAAKPRKNPPVTDYGLTGEQSKDVATPNAGQEF